MDDWNALASQFWFNWYQPARVLKKQVPVIKGQFRHTFPLLTKLLSQSRTTILKTCKGVRHLHTWTAPDGEVWGWLCFPPVTSIAADVVLHEDHRLLLSGFGGIDKYSCDIASVLNNLDRALGVNHLWRGFDGGLETRFRERCYGIEPDLDPADFVTFATEANGNSFVYRLRDGWTAYLSWDLVGPCWGVEEQASIGCGLLYLVEGVTTFREWVELLAKQHLPLIK